MSALLRPRRIALFAAQFLAVFVLVVLLLPWVRPPYYRAVMACANPLLDQMDPAMQMELSADSELLRYVELSAGGERVQTMFFDRVGLALNSLNLVLLPSLLLATPVAVRRRLRLLGWGLLILFAVQLVSAVVWAPTSRCLNEDAEDLLCSGLFYAMIAGGQVNSFAIWGLLTWRYWFPVSPASPTRTGGTAAPGLDSRRRTA